MRSMAIITINTGATVQATALSTPSHTTSTGTTAADKGRNTTNCAMQHTHATLVAQPTKRNEPMRCTN